MDIINLVIEFVLHFDKHLDTIIDLFGPVTYILLFLVVFCETGLVVFPFLPGDSLIFAAAAFAARGSLNIWVLVLVLLVAAILGNSMNFLVGNMIGQRIYSRAKNGLVKKEYIEKARSFYNKYGGKAVVISRFVPIVRTFIPFVAGVGKMKFSSFNMYNVLGGTLWVGLMSALGYFFGNLKIVKENFSIVAIAIVLISVAPAIVTVILEKRKEKKAKEEKGEC